MIQLIEPLYTDETSKTSKPVTTVRFPRSCIPRPVTIKRHIEKLLVVSPSPRRIDIPACLARIDRIAFHSLLFAHYDEKKYIYMYISLHVFNSLSRNIGNLREKFEHRTFFFFLFFDLPMDTVCLFVLLVWSFFFHPFSPFSFYIYIYFFFFGSKCTNADRYEKYYLLFRDITTEIWELDISRLIFFITSTNSGIKVGIERACFSNICVRLCMFTYI